MLFLFRSNVFVYQRYTLSEFRKTGKVCDSLPRPKSMRYLKWNKIAYQRRPRSILCIAIVGHYLGNSSNNAKSKVWIWVQTPQYNNDRLGCCGFHTKRRLPLQALDGIHNLYRLACILFAFRHQSMPMKTHFFISFSSKKTVMVTNINNVNGRSILEARLNKITTTYNQRKHFIRTVR